MANKRAIPNGVRREVCRRYGAAPGLSVPVQCHYCEHLGAISWWQSQPSWPIVCSLEFDHVVPEFHGGRATAKNLVLACRLCNRRKGARVR